MYKYFTKKILFCFSPELAHSIVSCALKCFFAIPGVKAVFKKFYCYENKNLRQQVFGLNFSNPVGLAAGFDKKADLYNHLAKFGFSHIEIGTVTPKPQTGNPKPRLFRLKRDKALINRMGFNNKGIEKAIKNLKKNKPELIIGCNIGKNTNTPNEEAVSDYLECFNALHSYVDYFVVNVSCPNITNLKHLADKESLTNILMSIQKANKAISQSRPVLLKISPDLNEKQIDDTIEVVQKTGIDGIIATNTTTSRDNLSTDDKQIKKIGNGGLSGLPLKQKSTEIIAYIANKTQGKIPIIGVGGIQSPEDALEKIKAGATLVQVYTGFIYEGPSIVKKINKYLAKNNYKN